jgi:hypothetical protein
MNDLDLLTDLTPEAPLPAPADLAVARARLAAAIAAEQASGPAPDLSSPGGGWRGRAGARSRRAPAAWPVRRLALTATAAAAVAALIATALVAISGHGGPARTAAPAKVNVAAARFLDQAAAVVQRESAQPPGPDQFVYTENREGGARVERQWLSTDGNRPGLDMIWNGTRLLRDKAVQPCTVAQGAQVVPATGPAGGGCFEAAGYLSGMPTGPDKLLAWLARNGIVNQQDDDPARVAAMGPGWLANDIGKAVAEVLPYTYLLPAQLAALFRLMARTAGFTIVRGVHDSAGQPGVGVEWDFDGGPPVMNIFNPTTYAYLGVAQLGPGPDGAVSALVQMAFVDKAGQLP